MNVYDAIMNRRSIRKFKQENIPVEDLEKLVKAASMAAYPANVQPLKFAIISGKPTTDEIFECTRWAGYLQDGAPKTDERPTAYIAILGDKNIKKGTDFQVENGAAGTTIILTALEMGIASCWLGALNRDRIKEILALPENLTVLDLISLGYGAQNSSAVEMKDGDIKYYLDENGDLKVPKRSLEEVLYKIV